MKEEKKEETIVTDNSEDKTKTIKSEKKAKEKIKIMKFNKILLYILIVFVVMTILLCLLQFVSAGFSNFMWLNINSKISELAYNICQNIPWLATNIYLIIFIICLIIILAELIVGFVYKDNIKVKTISTNIFMPVLIVIGLIFNFNVYSILSESSHRGINEIYMKEYMMTSYNQEDVKNIIDYFKTRIISYSESLNRNNGNIVVSDNAYNMAVDDLENLSIKYEFLKGTYPNRLYTLSESKLKKFGYPQGLTYNFTVGIEDNLSDLEKIFVITHELCHVKGIARESDADYCSFLSGFNSNNDISKYSMYLNIFTDLLSVSTDESLNKNIMNEFGNICINSGYNEICNLYYKDIHRYVSDADSIDLYTYGLNIYKDRKEELKQYLLGLKNRFNIKIYTEDKKEINLEEANNLIDEESESRLYLTSKITEETYNKNMKYLQTISNYFPNLYLYDSEEEEESYPNYDYLKPTPTEAFATLTESYPEFSYDRSVRSILEYFNKYIFN